MPIRDLQTKSTQPKQPSQATTQAQGSANARQQSIPFRQSKSRLHRRARQGCKVQTGGCLLDTRYLCWAMSSHTYVCISKPERTARQVSWPRLYVSLRLCTTAVPTYVCSLTFSATLPAQDASCSKAQPYFDSHLVGSSLSYRIMSAMAAMFFDEPVKVDSCRRRSRSSANASANRPRHSSSRPPRIVPASFGSPPPQPFAPGRAVAGSCSGSFSPCCWHFAPLFLPLSWVVGVG